VTAGQTPTGPGTGNTCNCEDYLVAAQATIAAQATRIAELEGGNPPTPPPVTTPEIVSSPTPTPTGAGPATPLSTDLITPDPAECTVTPRTSDAIAGLVGVPDQAATDALVSARSAPGLDVPNGVPADEPTTAAVGATYRQMIACFNAGNDLAAYALWTDDALRQIQVPPPSSREPIPLPTEDRESFRVTHVQVLSDGQVIAVWDQYGPELSATVVQRLVRQNEQYLIDETMDLVVPALGDAGTSPILPATPAVATT
jgi:hypothetical protein